MVTLDKRERKFNVNARIYRLLPGRHEKIRWKLREISALEAVQMMITDCVA